MGEATTDEPAADGPEPSIGEPVSTARDRDELTAFPRLSREQIERLRPAGRCVEMAAGDVLFREGERGFDFFVVLSGTVEIVEHSEGEPARVALHQPGEFTGDIDMLTGRGALVTGIMREPGQVLRLPQETLQKVVAGDPELGEIFLQAFLMRRTLLLEEGFTGLRIVGSRFSRDTNRLRQFADRNRIPATWLDLESDPGADRLLQSFGVAPEETPVVIVRGERILRNPSNEELGKLMGLDAAGVPDRLFDLVVVGAGPAGLAAAVYGASEGLQTIVLDGVATGGQAGTSSRIENYLGFPSGVSGDELASRASIQAEKFGARISVPATAVGLEPVDGHYLVRLDDGQEVAGRTVVIATGARYRRLELDRFEELEGAGVFYAATETEANLCGEAEVVLVGGGNSAGQAATFLAGRTKKVYLVIRGEDLGSSMSRYLVDRIERNEAIEVLRRTEVVALEAEEVLKAVELEDRDSGERRRIETPALFVFIGAEACTGWLSDCVALDRRGFVRTGPALGRSDLDPARWRRLRRGPFLLETSLPGVFAAGDVRSDSVKRVVSAVADGSIAVKFVHEHLGG